MFLKKSHFRISYFIPTFFLEHLFFVMFIAQIFQKLSE